MELQRLLKDQREEILRIAAKHGASNVRVFGAAVRGEAGRESDVDFLVEVGPGRSPFFPGGLIVDLEDLLKRRVHVTTEKGLGRTARSRVLEEAALL